MPKQRLTENRYGFRGGLNLKTNPDELNQNELVLATNARVSGKQGAISPRAGTQRMHQTALTGAVFGVRQWIPTGGAMQLVAVANGKLYYKATTFGAWTSIVTAPVLGSGRTYFATMRQSTSGAPLRLYLADGTNLWRHTGTAMTQLSGSASIPSNVDMVRALHTRLFMHSTDYAQDLFWTDLGDPEAASGTGKDGGGSAMIDVLGGEFIQGMETVGASLLIATQDTISRFSGYTDDDIQIAQDTDGLATDVGICGLLSFLGVEKLGFLFSGRGPFLCTEMDVSPIGVKLDPAWQALDRAYLTGICLGYNVARRELWAAVPGSGDSGLNKTVYVYSLDLQCWMGPFTYSFGITCFAVYEDANGDPQLIAGCADGYVRLMDTGTLDDVLYDGSGGSAYTTLVELAPLFFDSGPGVTKTLHRFSLQADMQASLTLSVKHAFDGGSFTTETLTGLLAGTVMPYRIDAYNQGERLRVQLSSSAAYEWAVTGLVSHAFDMTREQSG